MLAKAIVKYAKISPRKIREVIDLVRGKDALEALAVLKATNKKASGILVKGLNSALANTKKLPNVNEEKLYISRIFADGGPFLKRFMAQAQGRATTIRKRTSHITIELDMKN
ncbi:MAG: 50S ribosomal protein L22 [Candidatus Omnitrophota bacterium]